MYAYDDQLRYTRYLYALLLAALIAGILLASGALVLTDNGFVLSIGKLFLSYGG